MLFLFMKYHKKIRLDTVYQPMKQLTVALLLLCLTCIQTTNITIAIVGTNDIHGAALPTLMKRTDNGEKYYYGGLPVMARLIQIIKSQYPGNFLYLDAGDQFQGGIQSSTLISSAKIMNDFYGLSQVQGSAIGNHQFDQGPKVLLPLMSGKDAPNLAANIRSEKGQSNFLPKQVSSSLYQFSSGIKIGVIGLATIQTPESTAAFQKGLFPKYQFLEYQPLVLEQSAKLKKNGANAVLILSHVGNQCSNTNFDYGIWKAGSSQNPCAQNDQIYKLISSLPKGTIHGVVQGHRHTTSHVFIKDIPVIGNINGGYYFNVMYLTFNANREIVDSSIQGPIPVCERVFQNTGKCNYMDEQQITTAGPLVKWNFHRQQVYPEPRLNTIYNQQWVPKMKPYLVQIVQNQIKLVRQYNKQCQLANLFNDLLHENFTFADFTLLNIGGFRTQWIPGVLLEQDLYNMFPFDNIVQRFNISGAELLATLQILQSGTKGLYQFYGIQTTVIPDGAKFKFVSAKMSNGSQIDQNKYYTGVTVKFLLDGGDDFKDVIGKIYTPRNVVNLGQFRSSVRGKLIDKKIIKKGSLINPNNPRIVIES